MQFILFNCMNHSINSTTSYFLFLFCLPFLLLPCFSPELRITSSSPDIVTLLFRLAIRMINNDNLFCTMGQAWELRITGLKTFVTSTRVSSHQVVYFCLFSRRFSSWLRTTAAIRHIITLPLDNWIWLVPSAENICTFQFNNAAAFEVQGIQKCRYTYHLLSVHLLITRSGRKYAFNVFEVCA